jgi:hypothetical protein
MRKWRILAALILVAGLAWTVYDWVVVDEGVQYFTEDRRHILLLVSIVVLGTPLLLGYYELSPSWNRIVTMWITGGLAVGTTAFAAYMLYRMGRLAGFMRETHTLGGGLFAGLFPAAVAGYFWWAFSRVRAGKPI